MAPKRKYPECRGCGAKLLNDNHLIEHLFQDSSTVSCKTHYICCQICKKYAGTSEQNLRIHYGKSPQCKQGMAVLNDPSKLSSFSQNLNLDHIKKRRHTSSLNYAIDSGDDYDEVDFSDSFHYDCLEGSPPMVTNVYVNNHDNEMMFVQFGSFKDEYENRLSSVIDRNDYLPYNSLVSKIRQRICENNYSFNHQTSSVRTQLPGYSEDPKEKYIVHDCQG